MIIDKLISELLSLPERVRKGDFVLNLSRGEGIIGVPGTRVKNRMVSPELEALRMVSPELARRE